MKDLTAGACYGLADVTYSDSDPFFPEGTVGRNGGPPDYTEAKRICQSCPVRQVCLEDALASESDYLRYGVRGGLTADERQQLVRSEKRYAHHSQLSVEQDRQRMWIYEKGYSDRVAAGYFGINEASYRNWRRRRGLPANYHSNGSGRAVVSA